MIALQRPSMGSSKPPALVLPFGFIDESSVNPFPSPTTPAPGPSLLDDRESKFLDRFFDGVSTNSINYDYFANTTDGADGFGWDELPPAFMGTTSSYGQQAVGTSSNRHFVETQPQSNETQAILSRPAPADVLEAATLLQKGPLGNSHNVGGNSDFSGRDSILKSSHNQARGLSSQYASARSNSQVHPANDDFARQPLYSEIVFETAETSQSRKSVNRKVDVRWGSDSAYSSAGFNPPDGSRDISGEAKYRETVTRAFQETRNRPQSVNHDKQSTTVNPINGASATPHHNPQQDYYDDQDSRPRKRRKSKFQEGDDDDDASINNEHGERTQRGMKNSGQNDQSNLSDQGQRKRKSNTASNTLSKSVRENLTEDQKRENHIKSEQKRRTLIREGFEDLGELVPGLRGGGFSKSAVLGMAADWLEELKQGNEVLRRRLETMVL